MYSMGSAQSGKENAVFCQYNIIQFGALPDGKTNDTAAMQHAVDDYWKKRFHYYSKVFKKMKIKGINQ